jgi:imidazolonepropionase-like amidohydrolase
VIGRHGNGAVLFEHVQVFDGTGSQLFPGSVLVRGNRIAAVVPGSEPIEAPDADITVVDGRGRTLMPGLVEGHAHLTWPSSIEQVEALVAATKTGGEMVGFDVGTVEPGRLADLLLVDGDPTSDVTVLEDVSRIHAVMQDGAFHRPPSRRLSG